MDSSPRAACPLGPAETGPPPAFGRSVQHLAGYLARAGFGCARRTVDALGHGRIGKDR